MAKKQVETRFGKVTDERKAMPFVGLVIDLSYEELLRLRIAVRERCIHDLDYRAAIRQMCAMDLPFFAAVFGVFHETRATEDHQGKFPVHLDPDQADLLACFQKYGGLQDVSCEKSRGIGVSYLVCLYAMWILFFHPGGKIEIGLLSKDEDSLDTPRRPSSLMGKLDLMIDELPAWMRMLTSKKKMIHRTVGDHRFEHLLNGNAILGYVPTNEKLRSARLFALIADEAAFLPFDTQKWLAAAYGTTPSIIWVSTHEGTAPVFYRLTQNSTSELIRISSWWWENRRCRRGLYKSVRGQIEILDTDYKFPTDYQFSHEHSPLLRSPWADRQFNRPEANPATVLQELYGHAVINMRKLFQPVVMEIVKHTVKGPVWQGTINSKGEFIEMWENAPVYAFRPIEVLNSRYVISADPSNGVPGGDYGGMSVIDVPTGEQVISGLFVDVDAAGLAKICVMLAKSLGANNGRGVCRIAYETTGGVGAAFENELRRLKYPESLWFPYHNKDRGESAFMEMGRAVRDGDFVLRDPRLYEEMSHFSYEKGLLLYTGRDGHGDGTSGASVGWQLAKSLSTPPLRRAERHSGELEPEILAMKRRAQTWSRQFED